MVITPALTGWRTGGLKRRSIVLVGIAAVVLVLFALVVVPRVASTRAAGAQAGENPGAIVESLEQARLRRDFDAALMFFADDATLTDRGSQTYRGKDEIRRYFQLVASRGRQPAVVNRRVNGDRVLWTERAAGQTSLIFELSAEAVVRDGKIHALSFAAAGAPARIDPAADGRTTLPSFVGLGAVLITLLGLVTVSSGLSGARPQADSRLKGRLVDELGAWRRSARQPG